MGVDQPLKPNAVLQALIVEHGLTQAEMAVLVNQKIEQLYGEYGSCTDVHVRRWLSGRVAWPNPRYLLTLEEIFGQSAVEIGFVPRGKTSIEHLAGVRSAFGGNQRDRKERDPVRRREFLTLVAGTVVSSVADMLPDSGRIGMSDVARLQKNLADMHAADAKLGGSDLVEMAARHYEHVRAALGSCRYGERVGRALYAAAGEFAASAGWFAFDSGEQATAEGYYDHAMRLALLGDDPMLQAHVWVIMAIQTPYINRRAECVAIADAALRGRAARSTPLVAALFHARSGAGFALVGEPRPCVREFARAERMLDRPHDVEVPPWLEFFGPGELAGISAKSYLALGKYLEAERAARRSLESIGPNFGRNRFFYTVTRAQAQLGLRDVEQACATATQALEVVPSMRSDRGIKHLRDFCRKLGAWESVPSAREFIHHHAEITKADAIGS